MVYTFASALDRIATTQASIRRSSAPRRRPFTFAGLRRVLETWEERKRFRIKLEDMLINAPHLIDDIGLTTKQVEAEIAKPFWQD